MKAAHKILLTVSIIALGGCSTVWTRPNTTEAQTNLDRAACDQEAVTRFPVVMIMGPSTTTPAQTTCSTQKCTTVPGFVTPGQQMDSNAGQRQGELNKCMKAKGYTLESAK